jgi:hypothetical protein
MGNVLRSRINIASSCHLDFFGVASSWTGSRFDTVEVCGSSPHGPTILLNNLRTRFRRYSSVCVVVCDIPPNEPLLLRASRACRLASSRTWE